MELLNSPKPFNREDWEKLFAWMDNHPQKVAPVVGWAIFRRAIAADRPDILERLESYPQFAVRFADNERKRFLEVAVREKAEKVADMVARRIGDPLLTQQWLDQFFIEFTDDKEARPMENALCLGANINAEDYTAWHFAHELGTEEVQATLCKWYARTEVANPQDPFCATAKEIHDFINAKRRKDEPEIVLQARSAGTFAAWLADFEKDPGADLAEALTQNRDSFGNTALELLAGRRALHLAFRSKLWDGRADEMTALWQGLPPVYRKQFDISAERARRQQRQIKKAPLNKEWKL